MKKIILLFIIFIIPINVCAINMKSTYSENVIIYDRTNKKVLHSKNDSKKISIASLTKIMTTITAIEKIEDLKKEITITKDVFSGLPWDASIAHLEVGDKVTFLDLLYASILPSGADATQALAINISGSVDNFVDDMNKLAIKIGMNNSNFENVTGLDEDNHYSTLQDLLLLLDYSLNNELFKTIYTTKEYTLSNNLKVESTINKYNKMMNLDTSRIIGSKTGYTDDAGLCISALFNSHDHEMILITTDAPYVYGNFYNLKDALNLIEFIDKNYSNHTLIKKNEVIYNLPVSLSTINNYQIKATNNVISFLPNDYDKNKIKIEYKGLDNLSFKNKINEELGVVKYYYDNSLILEEKIFLNIDIDISFNKVFNKYKIEILIILVILILVLYFILKFKKKIYNKA